MIRRGLVDGGMFEVPAGEYARLRRDPLWRRQIDVADGLNTEYLYMNVRDEAVRRRARAAGGGWALDRRAILKVWSRQGRAWPASSCRPGCRAPCGSGATTAPTARARAALLREAGYPNGFTTTLYGWTVEPGPRELALVQQQLAEVGIRAELDLGETAGYTSHGRATPRNHVPFGMLRLVRRLRRPVELLRHAAQRRAHPAGDHNSNLGCSTMPDVNARHRAGDGDSRRLDARADCGGRSTSGSWTSRRWRR